MSIARWRLSMLFAALLPAMAQSAQNDTIPEQFRGEWNADIKACGTGLSDSRLVISAHALEFYESGGTVRSVAVESPLAITVRSSFSGEGERWEATDRLALSTSRSKLTVTREGTSFTRNRCPSKKR